MNKNASFHYCWSLWSLALALCCGCVKLVLAQEYETPAPLVAPAILEPMYLAGEHHRVDEEVLNDGYVNYYTIQSDYGTFYAEGNAQLKTRVREIDALTQLDEISQTKVFLSAAKDAGIAPVRVVQNFATRPIRTIKGIPQGIVRFFTRFGRRTKSATSSVAGDEDKKAERKKRRAERKAKRQAKRNKKKGVEESADVDAVDAENMAAEASADEEPSQEGQDKDSNAKKLTASYFGVSRAQRKWAQKLGTDPYSDNATLQAAIKRVAWADSIGGFTTKFVVPSIPGVSYIGDVTKLVFELDAFELQQLNKKRLMKVGVTQETVDRFFEHPWFSPTLQTTLVSAVLQMKDVKGLDGIFVEAIWTTSPLEARFFVQTVGMLSWYHVTQAPFHELLTKEPLPGGAANHAHVFLFPGDHIYWTETIANVADVFSALGRKMGMDHNELWLLGEASPRCREEVAKLGWELRDNLRKDMIDFSAFSAQRTTNP